MSSGMNDDGGMDDGGMKDWTEGLPRYADAHTPEEIREVARAWDERHEEIRRQYAGQEPQLAPNGPGDRPASEKKSPKRLVSLSRKVIAVVAGTIFGAIAWVVLLPFNVGDEPLAGPFGAGLGPLYVLFLPVSIGVGIWVAWPRKTSLRDLWRSWMDS